MGRTEFNFQQFSVRQADCAMKLGTDSVLLGAWCDVGAARRILDVGTGCGIVALMAAQKTNLHKSMPLKSTKLPHGKRHLILNARSGGAG